MVLDYEFEGGIGFGHGFGLTFWIGWPANSPAPPSKDLDSIVVLESVTPYSHRES